MKPHGPGRRKKQTAEELFQIDESEVELDSLGLLFMQLIDADSSQDEVETSRADEAEVIPVSSNSEPLPIEKIRRVVRKVKFSHPLAHLDPNFLLKKQQHESRSPTQSGGSHDLISVIPNTPALCKHRYEVPHNPDSLYPLAVLIRQPLNPSNSNYQKTPPSSSESSGTQMPSFKIAQG